MRLDRLNVLDTTLRDGSYVIDFQFTAQDTATLTRALVKAGIELIEIGHGLGINASAVKSRAASTDVEYIEAAKAVSEDAAIGMFCIPGIATLDDLRACRAAGLDFVRIGANVDDCESTAPFIETARSLGLTVCTNFMKSYAVPPENFSKIVRQSREYGSQMVYLVDSAGSMIPKQVSEYIAAMRDAVDIPIGFHAHNNLQLAVGNSLAALDAGATVIDTTLLGLGRSSGNPPTEIVVPLMQRCYGACQNADSLLLLQLAETAISPLICTRHEDSEKTSLGLSQIHSMYASKIHRAAADSGKSFFSVVEQVGQRDILNLPDDVLADAVNAAQVDGFLDRALGSVSVVESLATDTDVDVIDRVATKTNVPITLTITETSGTQRIDHWPDEIEIVCGPDQADRLLVHFGARVRRTAVVRTVLERHPALGETLSGLSNVMYL